MTAMAFVPLPSAGRTCANPPGYGTVWTEGKTVLLKSSKLNVDADGAPNSYLLDGKGLSYTCDGILAMESGKRITPESNPHDWQKKCNAAWSLARSSGNYSGVKIFGFQTDSNNKPMIQGAGDPFQGKAYISTTSVSISGAPSGTQRQYVDALKIPYIVLPSKFVYKYKVRPGTLAVVYRKKTNTYAFAVFADSGKLGEASIKLHQDIGGMPIVRIKGVKRAKGRIEDSVLMAIFPERTAAPQTDLDAWNIEIQEEGAAALQEFGGLTQLQACAK
ncbi:glycoside hydrolase family 75 protein [Paucibacter sp. DJ1R-11]|uniref:glycoside hydrolase family 75 protein n=1 Tax=Paucibacter sp. DJ1R-11 TaxID=2893556 RepID=UPI0021E3B653|nr:glycoside hydrolase family 75 protein [Paucibacter sp. DJ1R-11]